MRLSLFYPAFFLLLLTACETPPQAVVADPLPIEAPPPQNNAPAETGSVTRETSNSGTSQEVYDQTLAEVRQFIESLNRIITNKNFNAWRNNLSDEYLARISSQEYLARQSESPLLASRKIVLRTPNDYFLHVVVPSRANSHVDEIEIADDNTVTAYFVDTRPGRGRLRVYKLRKIGNDWKIVE
jgi:hypothetical protein